LISGQFLFAIILTSEFSKRKSKFPILAETVFAIFFLLLGPLSFEAAVLR
jgi:hypothetical protein